MEKRVVFRGKSDVALESFELGLPQAGQARIRTLMSLISAGTEGIVLHRRFAPETHWDRWIKYPFFPGYLAISTVEAVGESVENLSVGDIVATRTPHASAANVSAGRAFIVSTGIPLESAIWFGLAKISLVGAIAANYNLGDDVLVIGAGPIGQMSVRWAVAAGVSRAVILDPLEFRLKLALAAGASEGIPLPVSEAREAVWESFGSKLPRIVIDTTGNAAVFAAALGLAADRGRVILLGDTGTPSEQRLSLDVITRGLTIVGAHDSHLPEEAASYAPFFDLAATGRFDLAGLNTHVFAPEEAHEAYEIATKPGPVPSMGIAFDWRS